MSTRLARDAHEQGSAPARLSFHALFAAVVLLLPFWGYAVIPVGERGILLSWLLAFATAALFGAQFLAGRSPLRDPVGALLIALVNCAILASIYRPLVEGRPGMVAGWLTTYAQYAVGIGLVFVVINLRPNPGALHRLFDRYILLAAGIGTFGVMQLLASAAGWNLNLSYLNPGMRAAVSSYEERTGIFSRSTGLFEEPRQFGGYLVGALVCAVGLLVFARLTPARRRRLLIAAICIAAGLLSTLSASALMTAAVLLALVMFLAPSRRRGMQRLLPAVIVAVPVAALYVFVMYSDHILATFLKSKLEAPDLAVAWAQIVYLDQGQWGWFRYLGSFGTAIRTWAQSPIVGVGLNNLEYYNVSLLSNEFTGAFGPVRLLAETGLLGIAAFTGFASYLLWRLVNARQRAAAATDAFVPGLAELGILLIVSLVLRSFATNLYGFPSIFFWAELGLAIAAMRATAPAPNPAQQAASSA